VLLGLSFMINFNPICCHFMILQYMRNVRVIFDDAFTRRKHSGNYVYHMPKRSATLHVPDTLCYAFFVDLTNTICCEGVLMFRICNVDGVFSVRLEMNY